ncbi:MAG: sensor histidine kinase [Nocardioides sp.]
MTFATGFVAREAADQEARAEARSVNQVLAKSVARPRLSPGLIRGSFRELDRFDRAVSTRLIVRNVQRVNIWTADGTLIYSSEVDLIGSEFGLDEGQAEIMEEGGTGEALLPVGTPASENPTAAPVGTVRIYTRVMARGPAFREPRQATPLLFEAFYSLDDLEERRRQIYQPFRYITLGALVLLLVMVTPIIRLLTRQVAAAGEERERLLQAGLDTSDAERRRIARDLHDGAVQDLTGTAFTLAALSRDPALPPPLQSAIEESNRTVRDALKSLRSLLSKIPPPEVSAGGLSAALADLVAPAAAQGIAASVRVDGAEAASDAQASLLLRVAQEAVRNAVRHSEASTLAVSVSRQGSVLTLEVTDNGLGFDTDLPRLPDRYGLTGMSSLAEDRGGSLSVVSQIGTGTTVRLEVQVDG